jgi:sulfur carrier protein ThiS
MATATFRFHHELNEFLAPDRRGREFAVACPDGATAKHMIEALGIPHTEVAALQVNGRDAGFDQRLEDGDRVEIHPANGSPSRTIACGGR